MRAAYMAQEILTSFSEDLEGVLLRPSETNGRYTIFVNNEIIFDRREESRFPEIKELKQRIRDRAAPGKDLGHSDRKPASPNNIV